MLSPYFPLEADALQNLSNTAEHLLLVLRKSLGEGASYDPIAVKKLSDDLDKNQQSYNADETTQGKIIWMYGAFLGKAIIENVGKDKAVWVDNKVDNYCLKLTTSKGEEVMAAPFTRVAKHLQEGAESSILTYFFGIDDVVRNGFPQNR